MLTPRQEALRQFISSYMVAHDGVAPSFDEMRKALGLASKNTIASILDGLERRGAIFRVRRQMRCIQLVPSITLPMALYQEAAEAAATRKQTIDQYVAECVSSRLG